MATDLEASPFRLRHTLQDIGPKPAGAYASPEIVDAGEGPTPDPSVYIQDDKWSRAFYPPICGSERRFIYVRGTNIGKENLPAVIRLYAIPAAFILWPSGPGDAKGWLDLPLLTQSGQDHIILDTSAGARFVTPEPFVVEPARAQGQRMAYVALALQDQHELPRGSWTLAEIAAFFGSRLDVGAVNVGYIESRFGTKTFKSSLAIGPTGGEIYFFLRTVGAPEGSRVRFNASGTGPNPPVSIDWTSVKNSMGPDGPTFIAALSSLIPADFKSLLEWSWQPNWTWLGEKMTLSLEAILSIPAGGNDGLGSDGRNAIGVSKGLLLGAQKLLWPEEDQLPKVQGAASLSNFPVQFVVPYSQGPTGGSVTLLLKCKNVPDGSEVGFHAPTLGPTPPIVVPLTPVHNQNGVFIVGLDTNIPANYTTDIFISWLSNGKTPPQNMSFAIEAFIHVNAGGLSAEAPVQQLVKETADVWVILGEEVFCTSQQDIKCALAVQVQLARGGDQFRLRLETTIKDSSVEAIVPLKGDLDQRIAGPAGTALLLRVDGWRYDLPLLSFHALFRLFIGTEVITLVDEDFAFDIPDGPQALAARLLPPSAAPAAQVTR